MEVMKVQGVSKVFQEKVAVDHISFTVEKGTVTALLGPNGAGKTTMISMLLGLLEPTEGTVTLFDQQPRETAVRNRMGAMMQEVSVVDRITVGEMLDLFRSYYKAPLSKQELLVFAGLEAEEKVMAEKLSGGQQRRLGFALALAGNPDVLFLDEPTVGMDIMSRKRFWDVIRHLAEEGKTIILTTHYLEEADQLANRIILMADGKVIADGTPAEMKATFTRKFVSFQTEDATLVDAFASLTNVVEVEVGDVITVYTNDSDEMLRYIFEHSLPVYHIRVGSGGLEEAFEKLVERGEVG